MEDALAFVVDHVLCTPTMDMVTFDRGRMVATERLAWPDVAAAMLLAPDEATEVVVDAQMYADLVASTAADYVDDCSDELMWPQDDVQWQRYFEPN